MLSGVWIIEFGELEVLARANEAAVKKFLTQPSDRYRPPYGRRPMTFERQCVFVGTTNKRSYLRDVSGNRRYWPVWTTTSERQKMREEREDLWAEALLLYNSGVLWWPAPDENAALRHEQEARFEQDPWFEIILPWMKDRELKVKEVRDALRIAEERLALAPPYDREKEARYAAAMEKQLAETEAVTIAEVFAGALKVEAGRQTRVDAARVAGILTLMGRKAERRPDGSFAWVPAAQRAEPPPTPPIPKPTGRKFVFEFEREGLGEEDN